MTKERLAWLDSLRGVTIVLVILHHCFIASVAMLKLSGGGFHFLLSDMNTALSLVRMPAFFLCSGVLFAAVSHRGWGWFARHRLLWAIWIIAIWSWVSLAVMSLGLNLYPWDKPDADMLLKIALLDPVGNIWFIYAIAILGACAMAVTHLSPALILVAAVAASVVLLSLVDAVAFPDGVEGLLWNLATRGFIFFAIGYVFSQSIRTPRRTTFAGLSAAMLIWLASYAVLRMAGPFGDLMWMLLSIPATLGAIYALQFILARSTAVSHGFAHLGRMSLEMFLMHQFFLAVVYAVLLPLAHDLPGGVILITMSAGTLLLSYAVGRELRKLPGNPLFSIPLNRRLQLVR